MTDIKVCYVTAFLDLDRKSWDIFERRSNSTYLEYFYRLLPLFKDNKMHEMFVYLDKKFVQKVKAKLDETYSIYIIPIDEEFLYTNSVIWRRLARETEIMQSESFRSLVNHRLDYPECSQPKYNLINNSKIDIVVHATNLTKADIMVWCDFGLIKNENVLPKKLLDPDKLDTSKITFSLVDHIKDNDFNIMETLIKPREVLEAGFFASSKSVLIKYQKLFHKVHQSFHDMNIVDDDIHVILQCIYQYPDMFNLVYQGGWLKSLKYFQLEDGPKQFIVVEMCGGIGNQLFQICTAYAAAKKLGLGIRLLQKPNYDMRQGSLPSKYFESLYSKLTSIDSISDMSTTIDEKQWTHYNLIEQLQMALKTGAKYHILKGYFQSENYFKEYKQQIRELFMPPLGSIEFLEKQDEKIFDKFPELRQAHDFCFIGIRRGDYITYSHVHNPCGMDYFNKAMQIMNKERYYIASDDLEWVKKNFVGEKYRFFELKDDLTQLMAGTLFKNYIISNSSYHWFMSYFSIYSKPYVIAPNLWLGGPNAPFESYCSIYRKEMIIIDRLIEI